jgi:mannose-1-phosphate guanylyltransferase
MFVWRAPVFRAEMERAAPRLLALVERFVAGQRRAWGAIERRSLDYALMEKASTVLAVTLRAGWDDVGSWDAAARLAGGAALDRGTVVVDSPGSAVFARGRAVALVGVPGVVVVDTDDALLVVSRDRAEDVRRAVEALRRRGRRDLL